MTGRSAGLPGLLSDPERAEPRYHNEDRTAGGYDGCRMLRRACQLAHATGWKDPGASRLSTLTGTVIRDAIHREDHRGFLDVSEVALEYRIDDPAAIALNAEKFATSVNVDPHSSHGLWELAAHAHSSLENEQERDRCLVGAAESRVTIAEAAGGEGMVAAGAIMVAIQELKRLPKTRQRRKELEERLRQAQASVRDEMGSFTTKFDVTDFIRHAQKSVGGKSLPQALGEFAYLESSPDPEALQEQARRNAAANPLSSIMPSTMVDDDGKVVAKSPGPEARRCGPLHYSERHDAGRPDPFNDAQARARITRRRARPGQRVRDRECTVRPGPRQPNASPASILCHEVRDRPR